MTEELPGIVLAGEKIDRAELARLVRLYFEDMVKYVVDVERGVAALGGELHADLTVEVESRPAFRRELLRWRDLAAELYLRPGPDPVAHRAALRALLLLTPRSARQASLILR
ncbi:MAG: DUF5674 family protein [Planctomycetota bacterium]